MTQKIEFIPQELPLDFQPTEQIYKALNRASRKLGELNGFIKTIPNHNILINSLVLQEAKDSSRHFSLRAGPRGLGREPDETHGASGLTRASFGDVAS